MKPKLIQFHDNRRPAYYGTWRKEAKVIRGWCPLVDTEEGIDYDVDSDEEWEDEPSDCEECNSDDDGVRATKQFQKWERSNEIRFLESF